MEATLTSIFGIVPLRDSAFTIGRSPNNGLFINHAGISRHHAEIRPAGQHYSIVDLGSTSGTFVNGERLIPQTPRVLRSGDRIQVGTFPCLYEEKSPVLPRALTPLPPVREPEPVHLASSEAASAQNGVAHVSTPGELFVVPEAHSLSPISDGLLPVTPLPETPPVTARPASSVGSAPDWQEVVTPSNASPARVNSPATPLPAVFSRDEKSRKPGLDLAGKQLQFTAFYPREAAVESWQTLLVYAHIEETLEAVREDARRLQALVDAGAPPADIQAAHPLSEGTQITIVPTVPGVTFQPERVSFTWTDEWQPAAFRFFADQSHASSTALGEVLVLAGPLMIAALRVVFSFGEIGSRPGTEQNEISVARYKNICVSYSQEDQRVVRELRRAYKALGDESFVDLEALRASQSWPNILPRAIESADVFQLFWSSQAARSQLVYQECQSALQNYKYEGFIRPIYWEQPLAFSPPELAHLHFTYYEFSPEAQ